MRAVDDPDGGNAAVGAPQVRSSWTKFVIACAKTAPEPQRTQLLSALAPLREPIREAGLISWIDADVHAQVCARVVAGIGGHPDFCTAAVRSKGGMSLIAFRSTTANGASTILPTLEHVSTPRCDVEVVVTEHGVADLRGLDDRARAQRIVEVAAPEHRAMLREAM
jgi:hypothetical protein